MAVTGVGETGYAFVSQLLLYIGPPGHSIVSISGEFGRSRAGRLERSRAEPLARVFRRTKIAPDLSVNVSKSGRSTSIGAKGAEATLGHRRRHVVRQEHGGQAA
jgi:hypothetical protein